MTYSKRNPPTMGDTFESNHWGTVQVIEYVNANTIHCVFDNTGNVGTFAAASLRRGLVVDHAEQKRASAERKAKAAAERKQRAYETTEGIRKQNEASLMGRVFESEHCGPFTVTKYENAHKVTVTFCNTGYRLVTAKDTITRRDRPRLRDPLHPTVFGVGYQGDGPHQGYIKTVETQPHAIWRAMLRRCYGPEDRAAYRDVTVCDEWLDFQVFADWYEANHPGTPGLELDKDIKIPGNRIYGPNACQFVTREANLAAKSYK